MSLRCYVEVENDKWIQRILDSSTRWNYSTLSHNPNITWSIVQANPEKPWDYDGLSATPNITWSDVQANPETPWEYSVLSQNASIFKFDRLKAAKEWLAVSKIKRILWQQLSNPYTFAGKRRLVREFNEMIAYTV